MIVADTHAWLWWIGQDASLSNLARATMNRALADGSLGLSVISVWEAAMLIRKGRLDLDLPLRDLVARCERIDGFAILPITPSIAITSTESSAPHADPADRIIAATAQAHRAPLVTKDERLHATPGLRCLW